MLKACVLCCSCVADDTIVSSTVVRQRLVDVGVDGWGLAEYHVYRTASPQPLNTLPLQDNFCTSSVPISYMCVETYGVERLLCCARSNAG